MVSARQLSREDKRRRIIEAAIDVFADKGFFGARVSEIAERAGVADGTIYLYFKSKDDLLISLFEDKMAQIISNLTEMLAEEPDPKAKMRRYIIAHLELVAERPALMQVLTVELRQSARFIKEYRPQAFKRYLSVVGSILEEGQAAGVFRKDLDPAVFRRALFGAIDEISLEWVLRAQGGKPDAEHDEAHARERNPHKVGAMIADFILRGLSTP